ncbi:MAG: hypothetical protein RR191_03155 [Cetobacterium sp.]|uniref:hypothetical protein n=1 Tax=Cetobacterium sp. TaxID=2071632 RepID=UPI002FCA233B
MKKRYYLVASFILLGLGAKANENSQRTELKNTFNSIAEAGKNATDIQVDDSTPVSAYDDNEVEIDLNNDTLISKDGVNLKYGTLKMKAFNARRDRVANRAYLTGPFFMEADEPTGKLKIDARDGEFNLDGTEGSFGKSFGYLEVGQVTGAEKPNDRLYFGGEKSEYLNGKVFIRNAWFTTDPAIIANANPFETGYHLASDLITIEPDKQVTFHNSDLFIGESDIIPFKLPWYRFNIRQGSTVPLFPMWGSDDDYGWYTSWGALYGDRDSKLKGGFAPKFADRMGLLVGKSETWYKTEKYGESRLNITDWLVQKKADSSDVIRSFDRWDGEYSHNYDGEYGKLNFNYRNATYNMIPSLKDAIEDYSRIGLLNESNWKFYKNNNDSDDPIPELGDSIGFYSLDTKLTGLGESKDITIEAKTKLISDKKAYGVLIADQLDDLGYGSAVDFDLFADVSLKQENDRYLANGYYKYLYDMDPGSTPEDLESKSEAFGFNFVDKKYTYSIKYDDKSGDKYRKLNSWERDPNLKNLSEQTISGIPLNYTPWTVSQYSIYDNRDLSLVAGEYDFIGDSKYKVGFDYKFIEQKLDLENDPFREDVIFNNERDKQFNRYENIIYNKYDEQRGFVEFRKNYTRLTLAGGQTHEEIWDRKGIYNYPNGDDDSNNDAYKKYINDSSFYEIGLAQDRFRMGVLGTLAVEGNLRFDEYSKGYTYSDTDFKYGDNGKKVSTGDSSTRSQIGVTYEVPLYDNTWNRNRFADIGVTNKFKYFNQNYDYSSSDEGNMTETIRLYHKENKNEFFDTVTFDFGNTETIYNVNYTELKRAYDDEKSGEIIEHKIDFKIDEENILSLDYKENKRYTDENTNRENYNDLTFRNYGVNYTYNTNNFYYRNQQIKSNIFDILPYNNDYNYSTDNSREKINEDIYGYIKNFGENKLNLEYTEGSDKRYNITEDKSEINLKNKIYSVSYLDGGDVEHFYKASYEEYKRTDENPDIERWNSDVLYLRYDYRDKRFTDQELVGYAASEYKKSPNELSQVELDRVRNILKDRANDRESTRFNLNSIMDDRIYFGDYKQSLSTSIMLQKNEKRYDMTGDYWKSLEEVEGRLFYSYNRYGIGYIYNQKSFWNGGDIWQDSEKEHEVSLHAKIGKPSEGWRVKTYVKFLDGLNGVQNTDTTDYGKKTLDGVGVEIGKEFGYYEWAIAYVREYDYGTRGHEWQVALQFKLLTFPETPIFGLGAKSDTSNNVSPNTYLFDGISIDEIE